MNANLDSVIAKVRKLRALSRSSNANEAAVASAAADRLLQEYRLEEAAIEAAGGDSETPGEDSEPVMRWGRARPFWQSRLIFAVCAHYGCAHYFIRRGTVGRRGRQIRSIDVMLVGRRSDVLLVKEMVAFIIGEIAHLAKSWAGQGRSAIDSFRTGVVEGVLEAMAASKLALVATASTSTALVLASREEQARDALALLHPELKKRTERLKYIAHDEAFEAGKRAGRAMDLGAAKTRRLGAAS